MTKVTVEEAARRTCAAGAGSGSAPGRARRPLRASAVTAAGLAGVLVLGGCGGDGGSDGEGAGGARTSASGSPSASSSGGSGDTGSAGASPSGAAGELEGSWLATAGGKAVALVVTGTRAGLFATGGTVCSGGAGTADGTRTIRLTCTDGNKDRASGTVESVDGSTLEIDWSGSLGTETYVKAEGGKLPSGLPTAGLRG
ncbi:hypothetical protein [Streptomyces griseoviridis]|uniref:Uncharacterized protein n=1 Tax=Streptomyces griseoviridis TaxID=45398 RepID=A0A918GUN2_STRGD|nr:hypothetical protein [Streptomyces niveoruber]GGS66330.1 hypothetical protein GCM10010238_63890 [Streptomyces niveoruber]